MASIIPKKKRCAAERTPFSLEWIAQEDHRGSTQHNAHPLFPGKLLPEEQHCRQGVEHHAATINNREEDSAFHHAGKIQVPLVVQGNTDTADNETSD